ncbi:unnamed protein product [Zymoseptoria tritici ST99CH_3D7]|uniref:NAD(P)-binding domain-containing protein n=1 Tax=Zymoseptoria tritici (strain ST99CH_3D7) TaxID=1276538 RepID=A0A1X7RFR9_ZYMT9|nr:unnamed protein product [Zymoseptoria tritici ST99CH_3D7]
MASVCLVGATGLVGSHILSTLKTTEKVKKIPAFARRELPADAKLEAIVSKDTTSWPQQFPTGIDLFVSALGTTRAAAGGLDEQRKIDYDLNLALAQAAKAAGTKAYVLISSSGANSSSMMGYAKLKGDLEDAVAAVGFEHVIIIRPGLIVGSRNESRIPEFVLRKIADCAGAVSAKLKDPWAQDSDVIAKAAVKAGLECLSGKTKEKVQIIGQSDVIRLGRTEWNL